jgi:hypothetical protein
MMKRVGGLVEVRLDKENWLNYRHKQLGKLSGFQGGDKDESRILEYENPVGTSQEIHYVSSRETSRLMLCQISSSYRCD